MNDRNAEATRSRDHSNAAGSVPSQDLRYESIIDRELKDLDK
jgi:hypothetical protein